RLYYKGIYTGWDATKDKLRAPDLARDEFPEDTIISREPHFPANNDRDCLNTFARLQHSLANFHSCPRSDTQNQQDLPRRQIREGELANFLLFRRQFNWTLLDKKTPRLERIDRSKDATPNDWLPQRFRLQDEVRQRYQRGRPVAAIHAFSCVCTRAFEPLPVNNRKVRFPTFGPERRVRAKSHPQRL